MEKLNWGLIGAGDIVRRRVAPAMAELENCKIVAVSRRRPDLAAEFASKFGIANCYTDWHDLLADPSLQAVYVATPVFLHAEQAIAAAGAGKHVLCEKPMAMNAGECGRMIAACRENGVTLGVAYYRRFYPVLERVRRLIADGAVGKPVFVQINAFEYFDPAADDTRHWLIEKEKSGGGPMMDFGCHRLEVLTDLFGKVSEITSIVTNVNFNRGVEDTAAVLLRFETGPIASLVVTHAARERRDTLEIFGSKGSVHIPALNIGDLVLKTADGETLEHHSPHANLHLPLIRDFADAVLTSREPRVGGETGRMIAELEDAIYSGLT